jgi:hypothetical protein
MPCDNLKQNLEICNCSYPGCPRKGRCCECLSYHLSHNQLPACAFPDDVERTYDRSFAGFIACRGK